MLENERIIVQDRGGIDAGIAALMQNANKGFDPAALMAMMNNGNGMFGGNGGWWWIFIIVLFWMWGGWGGNGFGRGNQAETNSDFARLAAMGNQNNNTDLLMQAINGNKDAINTLSTNLNCDVKSIDNALCSIQNAIGKVGSEVGFSAERVINAVNAGDCNVIKAISDCCCTTQRSIDAVNLNLTQMNADNRLSICQQTNTLQNAITSGFNTLSSENATRFNILGAKIDAQTQIINDKFCQLEMREMQNKIDTLRDEKNALQSSALLQQQTSNIVSQIRPCPVPVIFNPFGRNNTVNILDLVIPKVKTIAIGESTENVVLGICPKVWCRLPKEGVIVLEVRHTAEASGASLPVFISVSGSVSTASNTRNIPLVNASSEPITGSQVSAGNRYIAYFNKCDNVIQLMNYTPAPAA